MSNKNNNHTLLKVIGGVAGTAAAAYGGFSYVVFRNAFDLQHSSLFGNEAVRQLHAGYGEKNEWFTHSTRDDEFLKSFDGLKLHALRVTNQPETHKWIVMVHGIGSYSGNLLEQMYQADQHGFNVLAVDQRGCGMSEGKYTGLGWNEHYDLISWINYLLNIDPEANIALYGLNSGAAAVIDVTGDYIPSNVKCAVEDGGFSEIKDILLYGIRKYCHIDGKAFLPGVDVLVKQFLHFSIKDVSMNHQLKMSTTPTLFMHGTDDDVVPASMLFDNYYACAAEKELYTAEGKGFNEADTAEDYYSVMFAFIDKYIK